MAVMADYSPCTPRRYKLVPCLEYEDNCRFCWLMLCLLIMAPDRAVASSPQVANVVIASMPHVVDTTFVAALLCACSWQPHTPTASAITQPYRAC